MLEYVSSVANFITAYVPIRRPVHCLHAIMPSLQMTRRKACSDAKIPLPMPGIDPSTLSSRGVRSPLSYRTFRNSCSLEAFGLFDLYLFFTFGTPSEYSKYQDGSVADATHAFQKRKPSQHST